MMGTGRALEITLVRCSFSWFYCKSGLSVVEEYLFSFEEISFKENQETLGLD